MSTQTMIIEFEQLKADLQTLVAPIQGLLVTDQTTMEAALHHGSVLVAMKKRINEKGDELTRPLFTRQREINAEKNGLLDLLATPERHLRDQLAAFRAEQDRLKRAAEEKLRREREEREKREAEEREAAKAILGDTSEDNALEQARISGEAARAEARAQAAASAAAVKVKGSSMVWKFEIEDGEKVPRNLCSPDEKKIRGAVQMGLRQIDGVRIYQEVQTRLGGAR